MNREEFINYIELIGFKLLSAHKYTYRYKGFMIDLFDKETYDFYNVSQYLYDIPLNDLTPLIKIIRSHKLKSILE